MNRFYPSRLTASAEAVFGSAARGDADVMSDRDILIVDDDIAVLRERSRALAEAGWSVASYTFAKLDALAQRGALFVQHIKLESNILVDRGDLLAARLAAFAPRPTYTDQIRENGLLANLAGYVPIGVRGTLLAADILYVSVRNFGVLSLAGRGVYLFAYNSIVRALEDDGLIAPGGARALATLRFLKSLYRAGEGGCNHTALAAVERALAALPSQHFPTRLRVAPANTILNASAPPLTASAYLQLRDLERRFVALQGERRIPEMTEELRKLSLWIENPRAYASLSSRLAPAMRSEMIQLWQQTGSAYVLQSSGHVR